VQATSGLAPPQPSEAAVDAAPPAKRRRISFALTPVRYAILVYLATRVLLIAVAVVNGALRHHAVLHELANWDGLLYRQVANNGYPNYVPHARSTLGFFPLYPLMMWPFGHVMSWVTGKAFINGLTLAGLVISGVGGLITTVLVQRLASGWWGEAASRRAVLLFCLFPGSVVFSMVYAEGVALPLAAGCILALQRRRWLLAGVLAGIATAATPEAVVLVPVCAVSAGLELRRRGWRARGSLLAPVLSVTGVAAFAVYLWGHAGTPFAYTQAQKYGWDEKFDPFAIVHLVRSLASKISFSHFNHPTINLNLVVGVAGVIVLVVLLVLLFKRWREVSVEALVWTLGVSFLMVTAKYTPPNPRLLITAFPAVIVPAYYLRGRGLASYAAASGVLLVGLSALTFVGTTLRP
jgi:Gpi18-like mannosyltransferase